MVTTETQDTWLAEIADRARRIETKLYRLGKHLGVDEHKLSVQTPLEFKTQEETLYEAMHKIRGIETSLHQLREHVGMEVFSITKKILVNPITDVVTVPGFDVTLKDIKAALLAAGKYEESIPFIINIKEVEIADIIFTRHT